jgi:hypothetical protein
LALLVEKVATTVNLRADVLPPPTFYIRELKVLPGPARGAGGHYSEPEGKHAPSPTFYIKE